MKFGEYDCYSIDLGGLYVDGGALFGIIPKKEWALKCPADDQNRVYLKTRSLLIQGNGRNILVDTGCGTKLSAEYRKEYGIEVQPPNPDLLLAEYDIDSSQITDVILSHLHFDHCGGSTTLINDNIVPAFPNAMYYVQSEQWTEGLNPHERDKDGYLSDDFKLLDEYGILTRVDGSITLFDGIELMVSYGHVAGQQHVLVKGDDSSLFFCSDLVPTSTHIPVPWHMGFDCQPLNLFPEKDFFLRKALRANWTLFFPHDPHMAAATVKQGEKWIELDQEVKL